jgi:uncharacterized protein YycO
MTIPVKTYPSLAKKAYRDIRPQLQSGDVLLCSGSGMFSKMIQKATNSKWSHVGFIMRHDAIDRIMVLESVESIGVRTVPLSHYLKDYGGEGKPYPGRVYIARHQKFAEKVNPERLHKMTQFAVDLFGYPYDKDEIIRIAARVGMKLFGFHKNDIKRDREYICSEYAWECYNAVRVAIRYNKSGFIAPADFARDPNMKVIARLV